MFSFPPFLLFSFSLSPSPSTSSSALVLYPLPFVFCFGSSLPFFFSFPYALYLHSLPFCFPPFSLPSVFCFGSSLPSFPFSHPFFSRRHCYVWILRSTLGAYLSSNFVSNEGVEDLICCKGDLSFYCHNKPIREKMSVCSWLWIECASISYHLNPLCERSIHQSTPPRKENIRRKQIGQLVIPIPISIMLRRNVDF